MSKENSKLKRPQGINEKTYRQFKVAAITKGVKLKPALEEALTDWSNKNKGN